MSILTKPYMQTGNAHLLPIDMNDPTLKLYLPFYYQAGDMTGTTIYSYDKNRHTVTANAPTWGVTGRTYNATSDIITVPDATSIQNIFDAGGSIFGWIYAASDGENDSGHIWRKKTSRLLVAIQSGSNVALNFIQDFDGAADGNWITTTRVIPINTWTPFAITYNSSATTNDPTFYIGDTIYTVGSGLTESTTGVGTRVTDAANNLLIGNDASTTGTWDGIIGEIHLLTRVLTAGEYFLRKQVTQWRYK